MDTWPAAPSQACSGQAVPHYQGGRAPPTPGARKPESESGLSGKGWGSITRHVPRQVTTSKPQFPQGLSFRAGPPAGWGSLSCSPASSPAEQQSPRPNSAHPTKGAGQQGADRASEAPLSAHGRVLPSWVPKQGTQKPGASHFPNREVLWDSLGRAGVGLPSSGCPFPPLGFSEPYYVLGTVAGFRTESGEQAPVLSLAHIGVIPGSQLLAP